MSARPVRPRSSAEAAAAIARQAPGAISRKGYQCRPQFQSRSGQYLANSQSSAAPTGISASSRAVSVRVSASRRSLSAAKSIPAKKSVRIPVLVTGGVTAGADAERLLEEEAADLIGVGRALLQDEDWSVKALEEI